MSATCQHGIRRPFECKDCLYGQHTPGPWSLSDDAVRRVIKGAGSKPRTVCIIESWTTEADARLIAAAPEMFEALSIFLDCFDRGLVTLPKAGLEIARAALAKAVAP